MGSNATRMLQQEEIDEIRQQTGFTHNQILRLHHRFCQLDKEGNGKLAREDFQRIPELEINPLSDKIISAFLHDSSDEEAVDFKRFVQILAVFRPITPDKAQSERATAVNTKDAKLEFAFRMYDCDNDGVLTVDELMSVLSMLVGSGIDERQLRGIAKRTIREATNGQSDSITLEHFKEALDNVEIEEKMSVKFN